MHAPAFDRYVAPARPRKQLWRLIPGLVLAGLVNVVTVFAVFVTVWATTETDADFVWIEDILRADTPHGMFVLLTTFAGMALGAIAAARILHGRGPGTLFGPAARVLRHFVAAAAIVGGLLTVSVLLWSLLYDAHPGLAPGRWALLLPLALAGVAVQTLAEELLFRGYLTQQLAARFRSPLAWLLGPAALFGIVHYDPGTAGATVWLVVASAATFGLIAGDLTARTGSIGAAWGFHFANNVFAVLVIATDGTLTGLALYRTPYAAQDMAQLAWLIPADLAVMVLGWVFVRRCLSR